ncbi:hypothetical protein KAR91_77400 [Candidatus Pacearchaeota archaeon]|nr:hypothetical protein [Candidatus Pacearchaeota archaeon]
MLTEKHKHVLKFSSLLVQMAAEQRENAAKEFTKGEFLDGRAKQTVKDNSSEQTKS